MNVVFHAIAMTHEHNNIVNILIAVTEDIIAHMSANSFLFVICVIGIGYSTSEQINV